MKTAATIERMAAKKEAEKTGVSNAHNSTLSALGRKGHKRGVPGAPQLQPYRFKPGQSGNPGGRPKLDLAAEIARAIFANDGEAIYAAFSKALRKGSPYAFAVLSDRAFGKLKERVEIDRGPYADMSEQDIQARIRELEIKVGVPHSEPAMLPPASDDSKKPN